jgi:hypothetical protein
MDTIYSRCAGLDVHKKSVVATVMISGEEGKSKKETRIFETMTENLNGLSGWSENREKPLFTRMCIIWARLR